MGTVRQEYDRFIAVVTRVVELIRSGHVEEAREAQLRVARPLANRLERLTDELVNRAEADVVSVIQASGNAYRSSQTIAAAISPSVTSISRIGPTSDHEMVRPRTNARAIAPSAKAMTNQRTEELIQSERKIAAYRQVQHDTTSQLYTVSSALLVSDERTLDSALRQLNQFGYDLERLQFVAKVMPLNV